MLKLYRKSKKIYASYNLACILNFTFKLILSINIFKL